MEIFIIILVTFLATLLSSISGGGSSVITLPFYLALGLSLPMATSIEKISAVFWVLPVAFNYLKGKKIDWAFLLIFSLIGFVGVYFGTTLVITINQTYMEKVVGTIIIFLVIYTYFQKGLGLKEKEKHYGLIRKLLAYPFAIILGFYEGIFGSGNGILFTLLTFFTRGFDFIDALGYYFAIAFFWVLFAAVILIHKGYYNILLTVPAIIGSMLGGYAGSRYAKYKGNKFIKLVFVVVGGVLGIKLILGM